MGLPGTARRKHLGDRTGDPVCLARLELPLAGYQLSFRPTLEPMGVRNRD